MLYAYLYLRVSTDEQAINGFSLRNQLDRLTKYCLSNEIEITQVISEDYSARTFNRPAWSKLMTDLKKSGQRPDILLFTKWDRFSRNIAEAYYVIEQLKKLKITPQAIEQPLDFTIPENKIILAVYIASSEVDNDRRSMNVKQGIHKAREEGRWTSATPLGYMFQLTENGKKIIVPKEPEATLIRNAFNQAAFSSQNLHSIFKRACRNGLLCHVSHFWRMMKNPVYNGKVLVPPFEGNDSYWVKGIHQPLIDDYIFHKVQERFNRPTKKVILRSMINDKLWLRGFIHCPDCGHLLTGSGSKGKYTKYYYYHCNNCKHGRIRADKLNEEFIQSLERLQIDPLYLTVYKDILKYTHKDIFSEEIVTQHTIKESVDKYIRRTFKANDLLNQGEIDNEDYKLIKSDCEKRISMLGEELKDSVMKTRKNNVNLKKAINLISNPVQLFTILDGDLRDDFLSLFLEKDKKLSMDFKSMLSFAVQKIYNLETINSKMLQDDNHRSKYLEPAFRNKIATMVLKIAKEKGASLSTDNGYMICDFMGEYSRLVTDLILKRLI